jgi:hypothetical protein
MRFPVQGIWGTLRFPQDVRVLNLSRSGIQFETQEPLPVGQSCFLELRHHAEAASIEIEVRWTETEPERAVGGGPYRVGARFVDIFRDHGGGLWDGIRPDPPTPSRAAG